MLTFRKPHCLLASTKGNFMIKRQNPRLKSGIKLNTKELELPKTSNKESEVI